MNKEELVKKFNTLKEKTHRGYRFLRYLYQQRERLWTEFTFEQDSKAVESAKALLDLQTHKFGKPAITGFEKGLTGKSYVIEGAYKSQPLEMDFNAADLNKIIDNHTPDLAEKKRWEDRLKAYTDHIAKNPDQFKPSDIRAADFTIPAAVVAAGLAGLAAAEASSSCDTSSSSTGDCGSSASF